MKTIKYIIIVSLFFTFSCRKAIDISVPNNERKIVLNTLLQADSVIGAYIFRSNHAQDNAVSLLYLNNAKVDVFKDGIFLETLALDTLGYYKSASHTVEKEAEYELRVDVPNLQSVKGKTAIVNQIPIVSIDSIGLSTLYDGNMLYVIYEVVFQDPPGEEDFYRILLKSQFTNADLPADTTFWGEGPDDFYVDYPFYINEQFEVIDPSIEIWAYLDEYRYFSDLTFDGQQKGLQIAVPYSEEYNLGFYAYLEHVTPEFYRYMQSVTAQDETQGMSLFFQAVQVYINVEGGYGIVGSTTADVDSLLYDLDLDKRLEQSRN